MATYNEEYVEKFLNGEISYEDFVNNGQANSKLWQDFLYSMFAKGVLQKDQYDVSAAGGKIDKMSDLDNSPSADWQTSNFFNTDVVETEWNESMDSIRIKFKDFFSEYINLPYPDKDTYDIRTKIIAKLRNCDAGWRFDVDPWVKPNENASGISYTATRGKDAIKEVLQNEANLQFTNEKEDLVVRLLMPKYSRRVEIEDLNRNFWVIAQALTNIIKLVTDTDSPLVLILRDLIKETTELWQNVYYLWAAVAGLEDKFETLESDIKQIENGNQRTPLNIHLHFPVSNNIYSTDTWLRLFKLDQFGEPGKTLYDFKDRIKKVTLQQLYYFGDSQPSDWLNSPGSRAELVAHGFGWLYEGNELVYKPGRKYYPAYNGQGIATPGTEKFFLRDNIESIINSGKPVEITDEEDLQYGLSCPKLGGYARIYVEPKDGQTICGIGMAMNFFTAYDIGHPFINTSAAGLTDEDSNGKAKLKIAEVDKAIWDVLAYANYDSQGGTVEIVQNRILYECLPWEEEVLDDGKIRIYTTDDICLDHTVNNFANLYYERNSYDKKDMAQVIRDVAAFNYVYRVKNNGTIVGNDQVWDFIPSTMAIRPDAKDYFIDFLTYISDQGITAFESATNEGQIAQNIRGGLVKILKILGITEGSRTIKYSNYSCLLDMPKLSEVSTIYSRYNFTSTDKISYYVQLIKAIYKLFGFNYDVIWEEVKKKEGVTITGEDSYYSTEINENFEELFVEAFEELIGGDLTYNNGNNDIMIRQQIFKYIQTTLSQQWLYNFQKCCANPFLLMREMTSWNDSYSTSPNCKFYEYRQDYSIDRNGHNPVLIEIIATGTDNSIACFVNDYYKQRGGATPTIDDMRTGSDSVGEWSDVCVPMVNRTMVYKRQDGSKKPYIELKAINPYNMSANIDNKDSRATVIYDSMVNHGVIQGFSIVAADQYPQVKRDYLASYIQTDFGTITNYDFRFVDNPAIYYGNYNNQIINYTIRHIKTNNITGSINPSIHMDCHNCSLNIPYNLEKINASDTRLTDIFSVGVPAASATAYPMVGTESIMLKNAYEITHGKGYIYRAINGNIDKLAIADGVFGVHSALIDVTTETTQAQSPYMKRIVDDDYDKQDEMRLPFFVNAQKQWLQEKLDEGETLTWYDAFNEFFLSDYSQIYENADNPETYLEADKRFLATNILSPTLAYTGNDGGIVNLMDMYISTALPSLPYYRKEHLTPHGDSYKGFTTYGKDYVISKPLENYHQLTKKEQIYNQEYTNFNDIYIRDILPLPEQRIKPKLYADISVFSDLNTVFELKFLKDENRIKFPGLSESVDSEIDIETNLNINFVKIGNTMSSSNWNYKFEDNKPTMIYAGDVNRTKTNYIYNFNYENNGKKYSESDGYLLLHDYENGVLKPKSYPMSSGGLLAQIASGSKEELIRTAGFNTITDFYKNNRDSYYSPDTTKISYFVTSVGRESEHLNYSQQYWKASTLCHIFMFVPTILVSGGTTIDIADKVKQVFGNNYTEITGKGYLYCIGTVNKTEGFFNFSQEDKAEQVGGGGYFGNRWRQPFIRITSGGAQIKQTIRTTTYAGGSKTEEIETNIDSPSTIELSCGMWDIRLRDSGNNLSEDKYTLIKGDFKIDLNGNATLEPVNNFRYCNRKNQSYEDINNTPIIPNGTPLKNVDKNNNIFDSDNLIENSIFTDGAIFDFS